MDSEELNKDLFTADAVADLLREPPEELQQALQAGLKEAFADSDVKQAFRAMFTEEELESMVDVDLSELAEAVRHALSDDQTFHDAVQESLVEWMGGVSISVPQDEDSVDALIAEWQIPTGEGQASPA